MPKTLDALTLADAAVRTTTADALASAGLAKQAKALRSLAPVACEGSAQRAAGVLEDVLRGVSKAYFAGNPAAWAAGRTATKANHVLQDALHAAKAAADGNPWGARLHAANAIAGARTLAA